jgi:hypothetical protein
MIADVNSFSGLGRLLFSITFKDKNNNHVINSFPDTSKQAVADIF